MRGGPFILCRGPDEIANDPNPPLLHVHAQLAGNSEGIAGDHTYSLGPGDVLFSDYAQTLESTGEAFECITLVLARDRAHPAFLHPAAHGAILSHGTGPARLVTSAVETTHSLLDQLTLPQADLALQSLCELAGRMLDNYLASARRSEPLPAINAALAFIDSHLDQEALSPAMLAAQLGLSRSALYRAFEPLGGVENAIRHRRLDRSMRAILTASKEDARKARAGFSSEEQFARAFQARFGARPGRYRSTLQAHDTEWLLQQARRMGYRSMEAWIDDLKRRSGAP